MPVTSPHSDRSGIAGTFTAFRIGGVPVRFHFTFVLMVIFLIVMGLGSNLSNWMYAAFLIGLFLTLGQERLELSFHMRILVATGFLGGFTTFSTLTWQTHEFLQIRDFAAATLNIVGSVVVGMAAVYAGAAAARIA